MTEPALTSFQIVTEQAVAKILQERGFGVDQREIYRGVLPFYSTEPQTVVKVTSRNLVCWIYDNEAGFTVGERNWGLERADYATEEDLRADYLERLRRLLAG